MWCGGPLPGLPSTTHLLSSSQRPWEWASDASSGCRCAWRGHGQRLAQVACGPPAGLLMLQAGPGFAFQPAVPCGGKVRGGTPENLGPVTLSSPRRSQSPPNSNLDLQLEGQWAEMGGVQRDWQAAGGTESAGRCPHWTLPPGSPSATVQVLLLGGTGTGGGTQPSPALPKAGSLLATPRGCGLPPGGRGLTLPPAVRPRRTRRPRAGCRAGI